MPHLKYDQGIAHATVGHVIRGSDGNITGGRGISLSTFGAVVGDFVGVAGKFILILKDSAVGPRNANLLVVSAGEENDAKAIAKSQFSFDSDAAWDDAFVTPLEDIVISDEDSLAFWRMRVAILDSVPVIDLIVEGDLIVDDIDQIAALMVTALNGTSIISNASYDAPSDTLTIAQGVGDGLGDKKILVEILPPASLPGPVPIPGYIVSKQDQGVSGDDLKVVFVGDTFVRPTIVAKLNDKT